jgi:hypothetical protein
MYYVKGADQKEYGPISQDQIRQWISENRLNQFSLARADGTDAWMPVGQFPEFAGLFQVAPGSFGGVPTTASAAAAPSEGGRAAAIARLRAPAIWIIVMAALGILFSLSTPLTRGLMLDAYSQLPLPPEMKTAFQQAKAAGMGIGDYVGMVVGVMANAVMIFGALEMLKGGSYGWSMTAAIMVMLPCSVCCCVGLAPGIWAVVVLNKPEVKNSLG